MARVLDKLAPVLKALGCKPVGFGASLLSQVQRDEHLLEKTKSGMLQQGTHEHKVGSSGSAA